MPHPGTTVDDAGVEEELTIDGCNSELSQELVHDWIELYGSIEKEVVEKAIQINTFKGSTTVG